MTISDSVIEYATLKDAIKEMEDRLKELHPLVVAAIPEGKAVSVGNGTLTLRQKATWAYSAEVESAEKHVGEMKAGEKARGIALASYAPILYYRINK